MGWPDPAIFESFDPMEANAWGMQGMDPTAKLNQGCSTTTEMVVTVLPLLEARI